MSQNLIEKIRTYIEFNEEEERFISSLFKLKSLTKGEHFLLAGDVCRQAAFIESAVFRFYINTDERMPLFTLRRKMSLSANIRVFSHYFFPNRI